jgi:hypothetical protein
MTLDGKDFSLDLIGPYLLVLRAGNGRKETDAGKGHGKDY